MGERDDKHISPEWDWLMRATDDSGAAEDSRWWVDATRAAPEYTGGR